MHFHTSRRSAQRGFGLIESTVVVAVTAILAATATPALQSMLDTRRLEGAATQLATDIQFVRTLAVARNEPVRLTLNPAAAGGCWVIHTGNAGQCQCTASGPAVCTGSAQQIKTVRLAAADRVSLQANVGSILFDPLHGTSSPTGTLRLVGSQSRAVNHVVNVMGRVRSCSPQAAMPGYRAC